MRILYGVQGTGNGHISRCRTLAQALHRHGVEVDYLLSGRERSDYFDMQPFGDFRALTGLTFITRDGKLDLWQTLTRNHPLRFKQDVQELSLEGYDRVISDFEPVTAWAAHRQGVPVLGISHQASFAHPVPRKGEDWASRLVMQHYAPVNQAVGLHWFHFGCPILPPIIDALVPQPEDDSLLVYLPFESIDAIKTLLGRYSAVNFVCFHPDIHESQLCGNLLFHPPGRESFKQALGRCRGVISNGGFELASEALSLGKKLLLKPLKGQFEQASNALTLEMLGLAQVMETLDPGAVHDWLNRESPGRVIYPDVADAVAAWLAAGCVEPLSLLIARLWNRVSFPEATCDRIAELGVGDTLHCGQLLQI
jgi:uncharacterized protein (TIGR00661 family)